MGSPSNLGEPQKVTMLTILLIVIAALLRTGFGYGRRRGL
jgi:hypothetical protein